MAKKPAEAVVPELESATLNAKAVAAMLGVSVRTVWRMAKDKLPPVRIRRRRCWLKSEVQRYLTQQATPDDT